MTFQRFIKKATEPNNRENHKQYSKTTRLIALIGAIVLLIGGTLLIGTGVYVSTLLGLVRYDDAPADYDMLPTLPLDGGDDMTSGIVDPPAPVRVDNVETRGDTDAVTNVMLLGVDGRDTESYAARSDTNIILSVNTAAKTVKLVSLMRDVWVTIPTLDIDEDGYADYGKLNAAFYYGGFPLLSDTVEENFRLSVNRYIAVDFAAFEKAVDAMGGVDMELSGEEAAFIPKYSDDPDAFATPDHPELEPLGAEAGVYHLNGQQALAYCRIRSLYEGGDFDRQRNQRAVIHALIEKTKTLHFGKLARVLAAVLPYVQTNMSKQELLSYAAKALRYASYDVDATHSVPRGDGDYEDVWIGDGLGLWLTDPDKTTLELHRYLYNVD